MRMIPASDPKAKLCWLLMNHHSGVKVTELLLWGPISFGTYCQRIQDRRNHHPPLKNPFFKLVYLFIHVYAYIDIYSCLCLCFVHRDSALYSYFIRLVFILMCLLLCIGGRYCVSKGQQWIDCYHLLFLFSWGRTSLLYILWVNLPSFCTVYTYVNHDNSDAL